MYIKNKLTVVGYTSDEANALNAALSELTQIYSNRVINATTEDEGNDIREKQRMMSILQGKLIESAIHAEEHERRVAEALVSKPEGNASFDNKDLS